MSPNDRESDTNAAVSIVWLKRDLRLHDHRPLKAAASTGDVIFLYIVEPDYWALPDTSFRQYEFLGACLRDLQKQCQEIGGQLTVKLGHTTKIFEALKNKWGDIVIFTHEETGNFWTYKRDKHVRNWCKASGVTFTEYKQHGIDRGHEIDRDQWARRWDRFMAQLVTDIPDNINWAETRSAPIPAPCDLGLKADGIAALQSAGRGAAEAMLTSFLYERGQNYRKSMSSPITAENECSRMSPYLAFGTLSMREVLQKAVNRRSELSYDRSPDAVMWRGAINAFIGRLHWHCHFMQKLETEPELEWLPMAKIYDGIRGKSSDIERLERFENGATGYPFIDGCMRYLRANGWINFRMRAMLMSFASYHLWLRWQDSGEILARLFTDYEAGIHWPQCQMQSGETGINAIRIYSPIKQGYDQDPSGNFTRQWVPELRALEGKSVHEPWLSELSFDYPAPIVDHKEAVKAAKSKIWGLKTTAEAKAQAREVYERHGSRKGPRRRG